MTQGQRLILFGGVIGFILVVMIWSQSGELNLVMNKIDTREGRLEETRALLSNHPHLLKGSDSKIKKEKDSRNLMTIFSQTLARKKMDQQIVSLTPSVDNKKKLDKVRLQLRNLKLEQAIFLAIDLKEEHASLSELEIDIQKAGSIGWNLTGTWAMPLKGSP
jgi:hypothetical protein